MPAYNFKARFEVAVASGRKSSTIRRRRKDGHDARPGQTAYLFVGLRTKQCRRLGEHPIVSVDEIVLDEYRSSWLGVKVAGRKLTRLEVGMLARMDGFASEAEMRDFFARQYGLPFVGLLVQWNPHL